MTDTTYTMIVDGPESGCRLDKYVSDHLPEISRSRVQSLIKENLVLVNQAPAKASQKLEAGDEIRCTVPPEREILVQAQNIPLDIVYEDADLIVVNKPQGMVVHPAAGHEEDTLVNALLYHCGDLSGINGMLRPGIVHRIDKDTSGLLVAAKNDLAHMGLSQQWQGHHITRVYQALLHGQVAVAGGTVDAPIGRHPIDRKKMAVEPKHGRPAVTHYRVLRRYAGYTHAELRLETGRTHQIRVHMAYLGHPVAGDPLYGPKKNPLGVAGQVLHAQVLGFRHPRSGQYMEFTSPLPAYFQDLLNRLQQGEER
ncbi:MAG: RluA family pseudouridine synthase [Firmicutes bacterium]|nr:RluA family pseudouridine synthase [Bacillota bacterium]